MPKYCCPDGAPQPTSAQELGTQPDVCRRYNVSPSFLEHDRLRAVPLIPFIKLGRAVRYRWSDVEAALARMTVGAPA